MEELKGKEYFKIKRLRSDIYVRKGNQTLSFAYPPEGQGSYNEMAERVIKSGRQLPTTSQMLSLVYNLAINNHLWDEQECKELLDITKGRYFWTSTENLYVPDKGVYVYDNVDGNMPSDKSSLEKLLKEGDKRVRFAPFGFRLGEGERNAEENSLVLAHIGREGAIELASASINLANDKWPSILGIENPKSEKLMRTAIGCFNFKYSEKKGLCLDCSCDAANYYNGSAISVSSDV